MPPRDKQPLTILAKLTEKVSDRRRHPRFSTPALKLTINGRRYSTSDWSLGGFRVTGFDLPLEDEHTISGDIQGLGARAGGFTAKVLRATPDGVLAGTFVDVSPALLMAMGRVTYA